MNKHLSYSTSTSKYLKNAARPHHRGVRTASIFALLAALLTPTVVRAFDGLEPIGTSVQSKMRGGADVAVGDSALSQVDNPGTLSLMPRKKISLDEASQLCLVDSSWEGPFGNEVHSTTRLLHLHNVGVAIPHNDRLTFGLALHSKAGIGTDFHMRHMLIPFTERHVYSDMKVIDIQANAAYKITNKLSLGLGMRAEVATAKFGTVLGPADVKFGRSWAYGMGFQTGLHYQMTDTLALGLAYRSPTWFSDLSGGDGKATLLGIVPIQLGGIRMCDLELPQRISAGAAWDATKKLKLVGEARWTNYSDSSFHSTNIGAEHLGSIRVPLPMGYHDQWAFMVGAEYKLTDRWTAAAGYHFATAPVDGKNLLPIADVITQHNITAGLRYDTGKWWAGGGYICALSPSLDGPGYSRIPLGIDYGHSTVHQTVHSISLGFGFRW